MIRERNRKYPLTRVKVHSISVIEKHFEWCDIHYFRVSITVMEMNSSLTPFFLFTSLWESRHQTERESEWYEKYVFVSFWVGRLKGRSQSPQAEQSAWQLSKSLPISIISTRRFHFIPPCNKAPVSWWILIEKESRDLTSAFHLKHLE